MPLSKKDHPVIAVHLEEESSLNATDNNGQASSTTTISLATWQDWFQTWLELLTPDLPTATSYELGLRLTGDHGIQQFNQQFRQREEPTDVLAFAALEVQVPIADAQLKQSEPLYLGDILISVETAARQAELHGHSLTVELAWLAAHGLLHLLGWDHPDEDSLCLMWAQQNRLLQEVKLQRDEGPNQAEVTHLHTNPQERPLAWRIAPNLLISFQYAGNGVRYAFMTQRNFRIHTVIGVVAIAFGVLLGITAVEMAVIGLTCALVLVLELLNTAIESVVDLTVGQHYHELAKIAKDCAAGAVLISALAAVLVAGYILVPKVFLYWL